MVPSALLEKSTLQHTYMEAEDFVFMDMATYEETRLTAKQIGDGRKYLKEGMEVNVVSWKDNPIEVDRQGLQGCPEGRHRQVCGDQYQRRTESIGFRSREERLAYRHS